MTIDGDRKYLRLYELETLVWGTGKEVRLTEQRHLVDCIHCGERKEPMSVGPSFSIESYVLVRKRGLRTKFVLRL